MQNHIRLLTGLDERIPGQSRHMYGGSPASPDDLLRIEQLMGLDLPEALRSMLSVHNGGGIWANILSWGPYSTGSIATQWHRLTDFDQADETLLTDRGFITGACARIGSRLLRRIPVAEACSGCAFIDYDPAPPAGGVAQVVEYTTMNEPIFVAKSFAALLEHVAHLVRSESVIWTDAKGWHVPGAEPWTLRPWEASGDWRPTGEHRPGPLAHVPPSATEQAAFDTLIDRLLAALQPTRFDPTLRRLNPPATEGQVRAAEAALGTALPPFVRALYQRFNGVTVAPELQVPSARGPEAMPALFADGSMDEDFHAEGPPWFDLLSLEDMVAAWRAERDAGLPLAPHAGDTSLLTVRHDNQSALWIPLTTKRLPDFNERRYIDFTPGPAGLHGQLIHASHGWGPEWQSHKSVQGYVEHLVYCVEQGWIEPRQGGWFDPRRNAQVVNLWTVTGLDWRPPSDPF